MPLNPNAFTERDAEDVLLAHLGLASVPRLACQRTSIAGLKTMLGRSRLAAGPMEGLVARREAAGYKLVNAAFTQAIDTHWSKGALERNALLQPAPVRDSTTTSDQPVAPTLKENTSC